MIAVWACESPRFGIDFSTTLVTLPPTPHKWLASHRLQKGVCQKLKRSRCSAREFNFEWKMIIHFSEDTTLRSWSLHRCLKPRPSCSNTQLRITLGTPIRCKHSLDRSIADPTNFSVEEWGIVIDNYLVLNIWGEEMNRGEYESCSNYWGRVGQSSFQRMILMPLSRWSFILMCVKQRKKKISYNNTTYDKVLSAYNPLQSLAQVSRIEGRHWTTQMRLCHFASQPRLKRVRQISPHRLIRMRSEIAMTTESL